MSKVAHRWCSLVALFILFLAGCFEPTPTLAPSPTDTSSPIPSPTPTPAAESEFLAFQSNEEGNWEIYLGDRLGGPTFNLTNNPADDRAPAFSPDGRYLAFESHRHGNWEIYIMELESGEVRGVTNHSAYDGAPAWSPNGRYLAFESYRNGNLEIYTLDLITGTLHRLTDDPAGDYAPAWSPDGRSIAFTTWREGNKEIYLMNAQGEEQRNLTHNEGDDEYPAWSPDGQRLAFVSWRDGNGEIYILDVDSGEARRVTHNDISDSSPCWSLGGEALIFSTYDKGEPFEVYHEYRGGHLDLAFWDGESVKYLQWSKADEMRPFFAPQGVKPPSWAPEVVLVPTPTPTTSPASGEPPYHIVTLTNMEGGPYQLEERAAASFDALRDEVLARTGWDYLGKLSDAFRPIYMHGRTRYGYFSWHKTGRAVDLRFELPDAQGEQQLELVREDIGSEIYWRMYIRCAEQDGSQGEPLKVAPWLYWWQIDPDVDPEAYEQGGRPKPIPVGYYVDFTEMAKRFGWERIATYTTEDYNWLEHTLRTEYWHYQYMEGLRWYEAMLEIYPEETLRDYFTWEKARELGFPDDLPRRKGIPP